MSSRLHRVAAGPHRTQHALAWPKQRQRGARVLGLADADGHTRRERHARRTGGHASCVRWMIGASEACRSARMSRPQRQQRECGRRSGLEPFSSRPLRRVRGAGRVSAARWPAGSATVPPPQRSRHAPAELAVHPPTPHPVPASLRQLAAPTWRSAAPLRCAQGTRRSTARPHCCSSGCCVCRPHDRTPAAAPRRSVPSASPAAQVRRGVADTRRYAASTSDEAARVRSEVLLAASAAASCPHSHSGTRRHRKQGAAVGPPQRDGRPGAGPSAARCGGARWSSEAHRLHRSSTAWAC